nr:efflux RND transporter periplasmic adaptor subunit [uncultured Oscillibacter sp.]
MNEELMQAEQAAPGKKRVRLPLPKSAKGWRRLRLAVALVVVAALAMNILIRMGGSAAPAGAGYTAVNVTRQDLTVSVSGSATLEPADSYQVTTLISGTVQDAPFEEDDTVEQGDLLYELDSGDAQSSVDRANISVKQSRLSYDQAQEALHPTVPISGIINDVYVHDGDDVTAGTALAKIVASTELTIDFLFPYVDSDQFYVGQSASVFIGNFEGATQGTVIAVSDGDSVTTNGLAVSSVRVKMNNPGIVSESYTASAVIGSYCSYGKASINMPGAATVYAAGSGTVSGFEKLIGSAVTKGEILCTVDSESIRSQLQNARLNVESAQLSAGSAADNLADYRIEAPISGTVIEKNFKAGDKVDGASSGALATIFDLSYLKMEMNVDELNIGKVQVGQTVTITASALPGQVFTGEVERVSVNGTTTNGFTTYPVTIVLREYGDLKPGMNVSAEIQGEMAKNALCVPVAAVSRGNTVQVALPGALGEDGTTVVDPTKAEERPVVLGINDSAYIEVTSGLEEGETVLLQAADAGMGG